MPESKILRDLGDGLILRRSTAADAEKLAEFNSFIHGNPDEKRLEPGVGVWASDLVSKPHPTFHPDDFTIVEDTASGKIVSSLNHISQTWAMGEITFGVGRPELVGTLQEYRNRGLVRAQFEEIHRWSAERGEMVQAITGIPYYYRLFGYEMALNLGGNRVGYLPGIPKLKKDEAEPYTIRLASEADLPFIAELYDLGARRSLVRCVRTPELWQYELSGRSQDNINRLELCIIQNAAGESVGFLARPTFRWGNAMGLTAYEVKPGHSWAAVTPSVVRYLQSYGQTAKPLHGEDELEAFVFDLGAEHPAYQVFEYRLPRINPPYAWYMRVPDLPGFIRHIAPVLEQRLANSVMVGHSGEHKLTFYRDGLRLKFEKGRLAEVAPYKPFPVGDDGNAGFPGLTFLQLVFGYRSLDELKHAFADCWTDRSDIIPLLGILFPKQASNVWGVN